jgi:hypothetical protein
LLFIPQECWTSKLIPDADPTGRSVRQRRET